VYIYGLPKTLNFQASHHMFSSLIKTFLVAILFIAIGCNSADKSGESTEAITKIEIDDTNIEQSVLDLIDNNEFERAFEWLANKDTSDATVKLGLQRVHLNYGLGLINMTVGTMSRGERPAGGMGENMYAAMREFLTAYNLEPTNEAAGVAREQLQMIMSVYATMPDRLDNIPTGVRDSLKTIGFNL
jgi:hypothetical protein